jgi:hypothetical protein
VTQAALDAAVGVAEKLLPCNAKLLRRRDLAQGDLRFRHVVHRIVAIGCNGVSAFAEDIWVGARGKLASNDNRFSMTGTRCSFPGAPYLPFQGEALRSLLYVDAG